MRLGAWAQIRLRALRCVRCLHRIACSKCPSDVRRRRRACSRAIVATGSLSRNCLLKLRPGSPGVLLALAIAVSTMHADARAVRRLFEPTDLELEESGIAELDFQFGVVRGPDAYRLTVPDFEFDLGLTRQIEIDVDGSFAFEGPKSGAFHYEHLASDNLWLALKSGLLSFADSAHTRAFSTGLQLGPKLPIANGAHGIGIESLALFGLALTHTNVIANVGALVDPATGGASRPAGIEAGLALDQDLDNVDKWSMVGQIGAVRFLSPDPGQLQATAGFAYSPSSYLSLSAVGMAGFLRGSDRFGVLFGVAPKLRLFGH